MKIVIVDDSKSIREMLRVICTDAGHEVAAEFADGIGLIDYVTQHQPDVVCLDFNLPGEDGLELLAKMDVAHNQVAVVMITGSDDPDLKGRAADLGANGFIHKPFEPMQVVSEFETVEMLRQITAQEAPPLAAPPPPQKTEGLAVVPRTAVIVDDSEAVRLLLKNILENIGIKVIGLAASGRSAIDVVKTTTPALICLDVDMPTMTGIEALPLISAASPRSQIVMITGNATRTIVQAAIAGGAKAYLLKPIRPAMVEELVQKLLKHKPQRQASSN